MKKRYRDYFTIEKPNLIVCEGKDDESFFNYFIKSLEYETENHVQVAKAGGKNGIIDFIKNLHVLPFFHILKSLTVMMDSDDNPKGRSMSIRNALRNAGFPVPDRPCEVASGLRPGSNEIIKTSYALLPNFCSEETEGELESLCLTILNNNTNSQEFLAIVEDILRRIEKHGTTFKKRDKNKFHTYLSLSNKFVGMKLKESVSANIFCSSATELEPLRKLLSGMLE